MVSWGSMLVRTCCLTAVMAIFGHAAERPKIVGIANIAVKVDNLDEARKFYGRGRDGGSVSDQR